MAVQPRLCRFAHPAQQIAFQAYLNALEYDERRKLDLEAQIKEAIELSPWSDLVRALQALKGVGPTVAATIVAEVGDFSRFRHPRQLVAYLGLAPGEHSSVGTVRPRGINRHPKGGTLDRHAKGIPCRSAA
jgi:transposase